MRITFGVIHINEGAYSKPPTKKHHRRKLTDGVCNYSNIYSSASPTGASAKSISYSAGIGVFWQTDYAKMSNLPAFFASM